MAKSSNDRLLISDYYDSLINKIDIYTETLLGEYDDEDILPEERDKPQTRCPNYVNRFRFDEVDHTEEQLSAYQNPYSKKYVYKNANAYQKPDTVVPGLTKTKEYINLVRARAIDEIRKVQKHNLDALEADANQRRLLDGANENTAGKKKANKQTATKKENLFADKFCFLIDLNERINTYTSVFQLFVVTVEFYMSQDEIELLKLMIDENISKEKQNNNGKKSLELEFNHRNVLVHLIKTFTYPLITSGTYGTEVLFISKKVLLGIQRIEFQCATRISETRFTQFNFSSIKSLTITTTSFNKLKIKKLKDFANLEHLEMKYGVLNPSLFDETPKLINLNLSNCYLENFYANSFEIRLPNLQVLFLRECEYFHSETIQFDNLVNLKYLRLTDYDLPGLRGFSNELTHLNLSMSELENKDGDEFIARLNLPNLVKLMLNCNYFTKLDTKWFCGLPNLKALELEGNRIEEISLSNGLESLEVLDLSDNDPLRLIPEEAFYTLNQLKVLQLSQDTQLEEAPTMRLSAGSFRGLHNLETLDLCSIHSGYKCFSMRKEILVSLDNLVNLDLSFNSYVRLNADSFEHVPKLAHLNLSSIDRIEFENNDYTVLRRLETLNVEFCNLDVAVLSMLKSFGIKVVH